MKLKFTFLIFFLICIVSIQNIQALNTSDVSIRLNSGYFWLDNSCTPAGPQGKVVSFSIVNTKGSPLVGVRVSLGTIGFTATGAASYTSGTPSFTCQTSTSVYVGDIATGDSTTAFFFVGYNCLIYPNNTNITTDYLTLPLTVTDNLSGSVSVSFNKLIYVLRNSSNNTITVLATSNNTLGTMATISIAYSISNVKPGNIIDLQLSTTPTFPVGYEIMGCKITSSTISSDFPVNMVNTFYTNSAITNLPSGGTVTIEWYLKITQTSTGLNSNNIIPFVVSDAGSAQRWQANTTSFTGTSVPVNPILISKRVNDNNVNTGDSVVYTIVVRNTSAFLITLDRLVDNLPRDYQFRYLETNTGVFPRLVTYTNSTLYPEFNDTNILDFYGNKNLGSGVFSWQIPAGDSIKLIYSSQVSLIPNINDTNFVSAYIGNTNVGTAFAIVNVYTLLPINLLYFTAQRNPNNSININWALSEGSEGSVFELYRHNSLISEYQLISVVMGSDATNEFIVYDNVDLDLEFNTVQYKLVHMDYDGSIENFETTLDLSDTKNKYKVIKRSDNDITIISNYAQRNTIFITLYDALGKEIYTGNLISNNGIFELELSNLDLNTTVLFITIQDGVNIQTEKVLIK